MPRSSPRSCPIAAAASVSWPTTSPITSLVAPPGGRNASYQSPPTPAASAGGRRPAAAARQHRRAAGLRDRVVPVAADAGGLRGRQVADGDLGVVGLGGLGQQAA